MGTTPSCTWPRPTSSASRPSSGSPPAEFIERYCREGAAASTPAHGPARLPVPDAREPLRRLPRAPDAVRTWPFWEENLKRSVWEGPVKDCCPGIGHGELTPRRGGRPHRARDRGLVRGDMTAAPRLRPVEALPGPDGDVLLADPLGAAGDDDGGPVRVSSFAWRVARRLDGKVDAAEVARALSPRPRRRRSRCAWQRSSRSSRARGARRRARPRAPGRGARGLRARGRAPGARGGARLSRRSVRAAPAHRRPRGQRLGHAAAARPRRPAGAGGRDRARLRPLRARLRRPAASRRRFRARRLARRGARAGAARDRPAGEGLRHAARPDGARPRGLPCARDRPRRGRPRAPHEPGARAPAPLPLHRGPAPPGAAAARRRLPRGRARRGPRRGARRAGARRGAPRADARHRRHRPSRASCRPSRAPPSSAP